MTWLESLQLNQIKRLQRRHRRIWITSHGEPKRKGRIGSRLLPTLQRQVLDQLAEYRRFPMTGSIALDIHATARRKNPPAIHQVAKYLLDALGAIDGRVLSPGRRSVLYRDDRQVKLLYVDMLQAWNPGVPAEDGSVLLVAGRCSDAIDDLEAACDLTNQDEHESSPFWCPPLPDDDIYVSFEPPSDREAERMVLSQFMEELGRFLRLTRLQEAILGRNDAVLASSLTYLLSEHSVIRRAMDSTTDGLRRDTWLLRRELLFENGLTISVPPLPTAPGTTARFLHGVRAGLEAFRRRWPALRPLVVPLKVTFLVIPPSQGKDLDNIALSLLPIIHQVLRPHIAPHLLVPRYGVERDVTHDDAIGRLRSLNADSVTAYQVVEVPRAPLDPPEGLLRIALGNANGSSWWRQASDFLEDIDDDHNLRGS